MQYLIGNDYKKKNHIFIDGDTVCRMFSTGGLNQKYYHVANKPNGSGICSNCIRNAKQEGISITDKAIRRKLTWPKCLDYMSSHLDDASVSDINQLGRLSKAWRGN